LSTPETMSSVVLGIENDGSGPNLGSSYECYRNRLDKKRLAMRTRRHPDIVVQLGRCILVDFSHAVGLHDNDNRQLDAYRQPCFTCPAFAIDA
jgi:hypothetical protein